MSLKTNELQKITGLQGTDTILVDTEENQDRPNPAWFQISESKAPADRNGKG